MASQSHRSWVPANHRSAGCLVPVNRTALANVMAWIARGGRQAGPSAANRARQAVMREAWAIKREEPGATFADCLRAAWAIIKNLGR